MSKLKFSDGMEFDTSGPPRIREEWDGLYVVGCGHLVPVRDREEARAEIERLQKIWDARSEKK